MTFSAEHWRIMTTRVSFGRKQELEPWLRRRLSLSMGVLSFTRTASEYASMGIHEIKLISIGMFCWTSSSSILQILQSIGQT